MNEKKHVHQYKRKDIGINKEYLVYICILPGCPHYIPLNLIEGRECICNRCEEVFIIDSDSAKLASPHCSNCTIKKEAIA